MEITLGRAGVPPFRADRGIVLFESANSVLHEARLATPSATLPEVFVAKRGKQPGDFGRLELEQLACERLDHPSLARYLGAGRSPVLGTVLAFESLGANPLLLLNGPGQRPSWRDPATTFYPLPPGRALELAFDALLALEHVHSRGFVHGGVTLSNLKVRTPSETGKADEVLSHVAEGTYEGILAGLGGARAISFLEGLRQGHVNFELTPHPDPVFAPPEALFESAELGGRILFSQTMDTYAWALVFYALLTGRTPYDRIARPGEVAHPEVLHELKLREARGTVAPIWIDALDDVPLHDVAFVGPPDVAWTEFRTSVAHLLRRCTHPDPNERMESSAARSFFEEELRLRPSGTSEARAWTQRMFQMRPTANRLTGDRPGGGISIREEDGQLLVVERRAPPAAPLLLNKGIPVPDGSVVTFRPEDHAARTGVRSRPGALAAAPRGMVSLKEVLVEFRAKRPLPVQGPFVLTATGLTTRDLARCMVYSLGRAAARVRVTSDSMVEETLKIALGRSNENDIVVADASVSKKHATIEKRAGKWYFEDLGSSNGSAVDGRAAAPRARLPLRGKLVPIRLGNAPEIAFAEESELRAFLGRALEVVSSSVPPRPPAPERPAAGAAPAASPALPGETQDLFLEQVPEREPFPPTPDAPTTKLRRDLIPRKATGRQSIEFPIARREPAPLAATPAHPAPVAGGTLPADLRARLERAAGPDVEFRFILVGARIETADTVRDALRLLVAYADEIISVEAHRHGTGRTILYVRPRPNA